MGRVMKLSTDVLDLVHEAMGLEGDPALQRVVVAMSGGVDSSVTAALLKCAGYDVVGITLQLYDYGEAVQRKGSCCAGQDIHDARKVATDLDIPHYVLDFESRFKEAVIDKFADSYLAGETPIPCVTCNQTVKFADLLERSRQLGAVCLATGHYIESRKLGQGAGHRALFTPADMDRDQSYFLFATTQAQIDYLRFPLGVLTKAQVRQFAGELGLAVASKPDSQDICFVPGGRYKDVIARLRPEAGEPGEIVHLDGRVLAEHDGIIGFTVGQRRGIGVGGGEPLYVIRVDAKTRQVVVGPREALLEHDLVLRDVNWLGCQASDQEMDVFARIRSTRPPAPARLVMQAGNAHIHFPQGEYGISPGQACVLYDGVGAGSQVLGGGFISKTNEAAE